MTTKYYVAPKSSVKVFSGGREVCQDNSAGDREYKARTDAMQKRQGGHCALCPWYLGVTFDHQDGRGAGGGHRDDRIEIDGKWHNAALCHTCNMAKGSRRYSWQDGKYLPVSS